MRNVCLLLVVAVTAVSGLVTAFHIEPQTAAMSGRAEPGQVHGVAQLLTCCWDELDSASTGYVELFTGFHIGNGSYNFDIAEYPDGPLVAYRHAVAPGRDNSWLRFNNIQMEQGESFTKGKKYLFHFWRSGQDSGV